MPTLLHRLIGLADEPTDDDDIRLRTYRVTDHASPAG